MTLTRKNILDVLERISVTFAYAFVSALLIANFFDDTGSLTSAAIYQQAIFAGVVALITLASGWLRALMVPKLTGMADLVVRVALTFAQTFLGALLVSISDLAGFVDTSVLGKAGLAGLAAVLSLLKTSAVLLVTKDNTASLLPPKLDPAAESS